MEEKEEIRGKGDDSRENWNTKKEEDKSEESNGLSNVKEKILKITKPFVEKRVAVVLAEEERFEEERKKKIVAPNFEFVEREEEEEEEVEEEEEDDDEEEEEEDGKETFRKSKTIAVPVEGQREHLYKILVIGELGTGKTSIIKRYVHQFFSQHYRATIGVDFALKVLKWDQNTIIRLQLWDIAGQERFGNMTRVYYKEAVGAFIVFDVTRSATFDAVVKWKEDLDSKVQLSDGSPIPCILLANKCDQPKEGLVNNKSKMDEYCRDKGFSGWYETSAKENINIEEASKSLVNKILQNDKKVGNGEQAKDMDKFVLDWRSESKKTRTCWC